jgi:uncharacterized repeat protein (TIGR03803 family)
MRLSVTCALAIMTVAPVEAQVQEIVLHNFTTGTGWEPQAGVTLAPDGIYGTAAGGGTANKGVVYKLDTAFHYTVLHNFTGADGLYPQAGVIRDSSGNLYGTTLEGGTADDGVVYKLDSAGSYTVLYNFTGGADGAFPAGVIRDSAGNLYGTTNSGGTAGGGVVYKLDPAGNYTVLYNFTGGADGGRPFVGVIRDSVGNLYGTTNQGGAANGYGVMYKLDADGNYTVLHTFQKEEGAAPNGVIFAPDGLYGTTHLGGTAGDGVVYKLDSVGSYTVLHTFSGGADGGRPYAGVISDPAGNLIGTTAAGGSGNNGVMFVLSGVQ